MYYAARYCICEYPARYKFILRGANYIRQHRPDAFRAPTGMEVLPAVYNGICIASRNRRYYVVTTNSCGSNTSNRPYLLPACHTRRQRWQLPPIYLFEQPGNCNHAGG